MSFNSFMGESVGERMELCTAAQASLHEKCDGFSPPINFSFYRILIQELRRQGIGSVATAQEWSCCLFNRVISFPLFSKAFDERSNSCDSQCVSGQKRKCVGVKINLNFSALGLTDSVVRAVCETLMQTSHILSAEGDSSGTCSTGKTGEAGCVREFWCVSLDNNGLSDRCGAALVTLLKMKKDSFAFFCALNDEDNSAGEGGQNENSNLKFLKAHLLQGNKFSKEMVTNFKLVLGIESQKTVAGHSAESSENQSRKKNFSCTEEAKKSVVTRQAEKCDKSSPKLSIIEEGKRADFLERYEKILASSVSHSEKKLTEEVRRDSDNTVVNDSVRETEKQPNPTPSIHKSPFKLGDLSSTRNESKKSVISGASSRPVRGAIADTTSDTRPSELNISVEKGRNAWEIKSPATKMEMPARGDSTSTLLSHLPKEAELKTAGTIAMCQDRRSFPRSFSPEGTEEVFLIHRYVSPCWEGGALSLSKLTAKGERASRNHKRIDDSTEMDDECMVTEGLLSSSSARAWAATLEGEREADGSLVSELDPSRLTVWNVLSHLVLKSKRCLGVGTALITVLDLSDNALTSIPPGILPDTLLRLDLSYNRLSSLDGGAWLRSCRMLAVLNLRHNCVGAPAFDKNASDAVGKSRISALSPLEGAFRWTPHLTHLFLGHNKLRHLDGISGPLLLFLNTLDISYNRLESLQLLRPLSFCKSLFHLIARGNPIYSPLAPSPGTSTHGVSGAARSSAQPPISAEKVRPLIRNMCPSLRFLDDINLSATESLSRNSDVVPSTTPQVKEGPSDAFNILAVQKASNITASPPEEEENGIRNYRRRENRKPAAWSDRILKASHKDTASVSCPGGYSSVLHEKSQQLAAQRFEASKNAEVRRREKYLKSRLEQAAHHGSSTIGSESPSAPRTASDIRMVQLLQEREAFNAQLLAVSSASKVRGNGVLVSNKSTDEVAKRSPATVTFKGLDSSIPLRPEVVERGSAALADEISESKRIVEKAFKAVRRAIIFICRMVRGQQSQPFFPKVLVEERMACIEILEARASGEYNFISSHSPGTHHVLPEDEVLGKTILPAKVSRLLEQVTNLRKLKRLDEVGCGLKEGGPSEQSEFSAAVLSLKDLVVACDAAKTSLRSLVELLKRSIQAYSIALRKADSIEGNSRDTHIQRIESKKAFDRASKVEAELVHRVNQLCGALQLSATKC